MIRPKGLKAGDKIAIVAPAGRLLDGSLNSAINILKAWGLHVVMGEFVHKGNNYFSGTDDERLADFQKALDNSEIRAIFCARGGYGTTRIIDRINFENLKENPKWIVGFSDITALHFHVHNLGIASVHSVMPTGFGDTESESIESLRKILFNEPIQYNLDSDELNINGTCSAQIIGGNLSLITDSLGTSSEIDFDNKILFIEEIDEHLYKIDRMMVQLKRAGKLRALAGLMVGHMTKMKDTKVMFGKNVKELILGHVADYNYPVTFNLPVGHEPLNLAIPVSYKCSLKISDQLVRIKFD